MNWRDRLALRVLRRIVPRGLFEQATPLMLSLDPGKSTPDNPLLAMRLDTLDGQRILSLVIEERLVDKLDEAFANLRDWAASA